MRSPSSQGMKTKKRSHAALTETAQPCAYAASSAGMPKQLYYLARCGDAERFSACSAKGRLRHDDMACNIAGCHDNQQGEVGADGVLQGQQRSDIRL